MIQKAVDPTFIKRSDCTFDIMAWLDVSCKPVVQHLANIAAKSKKVEGSLSLNK
jgi:hypothetical protein